MRKIAGIICCLTIQTACLGAETSTANVNAQDFPQSYERGKELEKQGKHAIEELEREAALNPGNKDVAKQLILFLEAMIKADPFAVETHIALGQAYEKEEEFGKAKEQYNQAIRFSPGKVNPTASKLLSLLPRKMASAAIRKNEELSRSAQSLPAPVYDLDVVRYDHLTIPVPSTAELSQLKELWSTVLEQPNTTRMWMGAADNEVDTRQARTEAIGVLDKVIEQISYMSRPSGLALTIPALEPSYPVPGGQGPAYLLPRQLGSYPSVIGALAGSQVNAVRALQQHLVDSPLERLAKSLIGSYYDYLSWRKFHKQLERSSSTQSDSAFIKLQEEHNNYRKRLIEMAGITAVLKLDHELEASEQ